MEKPGKVIEMKKLTVYMKTDDLPMLSHLSAKDGFIENWNYEGDPMAYGKYVIGDLEIEFIGIAFEHPEDLDTDKPLDVRYKEALNSVQNLLKDK